MKVIVFAFIVLFNLAIASSANGIPWQSTDPASAGWSMEKLPVAQAYASQLEPHGGHGGAGWEGDRQLGRRVPQGECRLRTSNFVKLLQQIAAAAR